MSSSTSPLLDLPISVRLCIYLFSGLVRPCPISLCTEGKMISPRKNLILVGQSRRRPYQCIYKMKGSGERRRHSKKDIDCYCLELPVALLRVCRAICLETLPLLYGKNKFKVLGHTSSDLRILRTLSSVAIASMTSLLVRLNCSPCPLGHNEISLLGHCTLCKGTLTLSDAPLTNTTRAGQEILTEWRAVCAHLAETVLPGQLNLTVICDTNEAEVAAEVMELTRKLPRLKKCTIRLSQSRDSTLTSLARQTVQVTMRAKVPASAFPFNKLPKELRLCVLNFTHLTPEGSYASRFQNVGIKDNKLCMSPSGTFHRRKCCYKCNDTRDNCCCPTTHASVSASCRCRLIPFELFLVSKLMKQEAEKMFYSSNCFVFQQDHSRTLEFLSRMRPEILRSIRHVRFMFADKHINFWTTETREEWRVLIEFVKQNFDVGKLCLFINTLANWCLCHRLRYKEDIRYVYDAYCEIVQQLLILQGLGDMYLELPWFRGLDVILERRIMGERYDSRSLSKHVQRMKASWYEMVERVPENWDLPSWVTHVCNSFDTSIV